MSDEQFEADKGWIACAQSWKARAEAAEARFKRLERALRYIARATTASEMQAHARAALSDTATKGGDPTNTHPSTSTGE